VRQAEKEMELLKELINKIRNIKAEMNVQTKDIELIFAAHKKEEREIIEKGEPIIRFLAKAPTIKVFDKIKDKPEQSATGVVSDIQFFIPLKGLIDIDKEIARLQKESQKIDTEVKRLNTLLANKEFTAKAPPDAVEKQKITQKELAEKRKLIEARIKDLTA